jgi:hypothetical protein
MSPQHDSAVASDVAAGRTPRQIRRFCVRWYTIVIAAGKGGR